MLVGTAHAEVTPPLGSHIQGATTYEVAKRVRDPLEANVLYLAQDGVEVLFASVDCCGLESEDVRRLRMAMAAAANIPERSIIISGTHMHSGPSVIATCYQKPIDRHFLDDILGRVLPELAVQAVANAVPAQIAWGTGTAEIGYNRRCCWLDGSHTMHGNTQREDFTGLEGPDDTQHCSLFVRDMDNRIRAVVYQNTTHPTSFYAKDFFSADFIGQARRYFRDAFHDDLSVIFWNGCFGDISQENQLLPAPYHEPLDQKVFRLAHIVCGETLRQLHHATWHAEVPFRHLCEDLSVAVRLPTPERIEASRALLARVDAGETVDGMQVVSAFGAISLQDRFGDNPKEALAMHAIRIGDMAMVTHPCELYAQFGLDIKRRSPAPITAIAGITDGYGGYCPGIYGHLGGGYSGEAIAWCRLASEAGYQMVEHAAGLLHRVWFG